MTDIYDAWKARAKEIGIEWGKGHTLEVTYPTGVKLHEGLYADASMAQMNATLRMAADPALKIKVVAA
jgi:hypothetical protein